MLKLSDETIYGGPEVIEIMADDISNLPDNIINIGCYGQLRLNYLKEIGNVTQLERLMRTGHPQRELAFFNAMVQQRIAELQEFLVGWYQLHNIEITQEDINQKAEEIAIQELVYM